MFKIITLLSLFLFVAACGDNAKKDSEPESANQNNQNPPPDPLTTAKADAKNTKIKKSEDLHNATKYNDAKYAVLKGPFKLVIDKAIADVNAATTIPAVTTAVGPLKNAKKAFKEGVAVKDAEDKIAEADIVIGIAKPLEATNPTLTPLINVLTTAKGELDAAVKAININITDIETGITKVNSALTALKNNATYSNGAKDAAIALYDAFKGNIADDKIATDKKLEDALKALTDLKLPTDPDVSEPINKINAEQTRRSEEARLAKEEAEKLAEAVTKAGDKIKDVDGKISEANERVNKSFFPANDPKNLKDAIAQVETAKENLNKAKTVEAINKAIEKVDAELSKLEVAKKAFDTKEQELADAISTAKNEIETATKAITEAQEAIKDAKTSAIAVTDAIDEVNKVIAALNGLIADDKETKENIDKSVTNLKGAAGELKEAVNKFIEAERVEKERLAKVEADRLAEEKRIADEKAKKLAEALELYNQALNGGTIDKADIDALVNAYNALDALTDKTGSIVASNAILTELVQRVTNKIAGAKKLHDDLKHELDYKKTFADAIKKAEEDINNITDAQGIKTLLEEIKKAMSNFRLADRMQAEDGYPADPAGAKKADALVKYTAFKDEISDAAKATNDDLNDALIALNDLTDAQKNENDVKDAIEAIENEQNKRAADIKKEIDKKIPALEALDLSKKNNYNALSDVLKEDIEQAYDLTLNTVKTSESVANAADYIKKFDDNYYKPVSEFIDLLNSFTGFVNLTTEEQAGKDSLDEAKQALKEHGLDKPQSIDDVSTHIEALKQAQINLEQAMINIENAKKGDNRITDPANAAASEARDKANNAILNNKLANPADVDNVKEAMEKTSEAQNAFLTTATQKDKNTLIDATNALNKITKEFIEKQRIAQENAKALKQARDKAQAKINEIGGLIKQAKEAIDGVPTAEADDDQSGIEEREKDVITPALVALQQDQDNMANNLKTAKSTVESIDGMLNSPDLQNNINALTNAITQVKELKKLKREGSAKAEQVQQGKLKDTKELIAANNKIDVDIFNVVIKSVEDEITILEREGEDEHGNKPGIVQQIKNIKDSMQRLDEKLVLLDKSIAAASAPAGDELGDTIKLAEAEIIKAEIIYKMNAAQLRDDAKLVTTLNKNLVANKKSEIKGAMDSLREKITKKNLAEIRTALGELTAIITPPAKP